MDAVFLKILNMSISATWVVLMVLFLRLLLKRGPKWIHCTLWSLAAVRLIVPFSVESVLSLLPSGETLPENIVYDLNPRIYSGVTVIDNAVNSSVMADLAPVGFGSVNPIQVWLFGFRVIWSIGIFVMAAYALISWLRLKKRVSASIEIEKGIYVCDYIGSPFILGILSPQIYLPSSMDPETAACVLEHERAHIARRDHWWKPLGYLLLMLHWFNPVIWLGYILLCRDIEMACDEKVIRAMTPGEKKRYSEALLFCSTPGHLLAACPLAFGEVGVKERVKGILNYRKPAFWVIAAAVVICIMAAVCFLTDPPGMSIARQFGVTDLDAVVLTAGEKVNTILEKNDVDRVEDFLKSAKLEALPISQNRSEDRPKDFSITWTNGKVRWAIYFDSDFTDVWMNDSVKPSLSYRMKNPEEVRDFFEIMLGTEIPDAPSGGPDGNGHYYFHATVLRATDKSVLVEPLEGCRELRSSDKIWVSLNMQSDAPVPGICPGDTIRIEYDGMIAETYPAQIHNVFSVSVTANVVTEAVFTQISSALHTENITLFDYQIIGDTAVMGCRYDGDYGLIYLEPNGTVTVVDQSTLASQAGAGGVLMDTSRGMQVYVVSSQGYCYMVVEPENGETYYLYIMNTPAVVIVEANAVATLVVE